jgi:hypothetical protein
MIKLFLFILSIFFCSFIPKDEKTLDEVENSKEILFGDYKLFMIYTRDSIMRELLAHEVDDFCNFCKTDQKVFNLNWTIPINFNHEEIIDLLTNYGHYNENFYNFLTKENSDYVVDTKYLVFRSSRKDIKGINIFPEFHRIDSLKLDHFSLIFGIDNKWNEDFEKRPFSGVLTSSQMDAYFNWMNNIGKRKAIKYTNKKIIKQNSR